MFFAYRVMGEEAPALLSQLPGWVTTDRFDIQARTDGDTAKDNKNQMRLMMRSLLTERFRMATHYETRQVSVFALLPVKPGKTGPQLQRHPDDSSCDAPPPVVAGGYPGLCGGLLVMPSTMPGGVRAGARNVTMAFIANLLPATGNLGRPVSDQTGLAGTYDFVIEWVPEVNGSTPVGPDFEPDPSGPTFLEALKEQLGLRLESQKGSADFLVVDHVEHPSGN